MNDNIVYLICYIPTPLIFLIAGLLIWRAPTPYGSSIGYRTKRSNSSAEAWDFAQVYWGRFTTFSNIPVLAVSVITGALQIIKDFDENAAFITCMIVVTLQIAPLFISIGITEAELKRNFGK